MSSLSSVGEAAQTQPGDLAITKYSPITEQKLTLLLSDLTRQSSSSLNCKHKRLFLREGQIYIESHS